MRWTPADDRLLKANCGKGYGPLLVLFPQRNKRSIAHRASRKGWVVCPNYTAEIRARVSRAARATAAARSGKGEAIKWIYKHASYPKDDCLHWPFSRDFHGYGHFGFRGKTYKAAQFICREAHGPAPTPFHRPGSTCGRGKQGCVNPRHLEWMTVGEIMQRAYARGMKERPLSVLAPAQIAEIREGRETQAVLGERFGVPPGYIGKVRRGEIYPAGRRTFGNGGVARALSTIVAAPTIKRTARVTLDFGFLNAIVPRGLLGRDDIIQSMALALLERRASRESLSYRAFARGFRRVNFERAGGALLFEDWHSASVSSGFL